MENYCKVLVVAVEITLMVSNEARGCAHKVANLRRNTTTPIV